MAKYTVRVELHGATGQDYENLHEAMEAAGYRRYIDDTATNGTLGRWALPTAEYDCTGESAATAYSVRDQVKTIAEGIKPGAWCIVTEAAVRAWSLERLA
ncbi:MAG TPA: hypothetical protein VF727_11020 [Allosphingosinicella sp.]|jgi:hypothetical protein